MKASETYDKMKAKARAMAGGGDSSYVGASTWSKPEALNADVQTGPRPVSRQHRKDGGLVKELVNRDVKEANEEREGKKHVGGMNKGGKISDKDEDDMIGKIEKMVGTPKSSSPDVRKTAIKLSNSPAMKKASGGMVSHPKSCTCKACGGAVSMAGKDAGGREAKASGGGVPPEWIKHKVDSGMDLDKIKGQAQKKMDKYKDAKIKGFYKSQIDAIDDHRSGRASGGKVGKTNINIIIQPNSAPKPGLGSAEIPPMPPPGMSPPMGPPMSAGAPPPMPRPGIGPMPGGGAPPMMGRATGGAVKMTHGAGGGLGRLEKIRKYGDNAKTGEGK